MASVSWKADSSDFVAKMREIVARVKLNTGSYGRELARAFESEAKSGAPWTDQTGNARAHLYGKSATSQWVTTVEMGGVAPNYKRGPRSAADYLEYLEFDNGKRFAIIYPTAGAIADSVRSGYLAAALEGKVSVRITRDKSAARVRARRSRQNKR